MPRKESLYPKDWFRIGEKEIQRAENLLRFDDLEGAGFNIQQGIEKFLKGYLLSKGWSLRRIHKLDVLLNDAVTYDSFWEVFRPACLKISEYYVEERYPSTPFSNLQRAEIEESLRIAKEIVAKIKSDDTNNR